MYGSMFKGSGFVAGYAACSKKGDTRPVEGKNCTFCQSGLSLLNGQWAWEEFDKYQLEMTTIGTESQWFGYP